MAKTKGQGILMQQQTIWMLLIAIVSLVFASCGESDDEYIHHFFYSNKSGHPIVVTSFYRFDTTYKALRVDSIPDGGGLEQKVDLMFGGKDGAIGFADSVVLKFDDAKYSAFSLHDTSKNEFNILKLTETYLVEYPADNYVKYFYTFNKDDYDYAK